jgi:signal transduction histidine kinase
MNTKAIVAIALAGAAGTVLASLRLGGSEALQLGGAAGGGAAAVAVVGAILLYVVRNRSIADQGAIVALTSIGAVAAGAMAASHLMVAASHPISALGVVLISAGTIGILISFALGVRVRSASERLIDATRQIGAGNLSTTVEQPSGEEFARLASELQQMQTQLQQSRMHEREAEAARRELVAWMSHDLRTPIGRIKAIVEALQDGIVASGAETEEYYDRLQRETDRVGGLVNDLLELNRISARALSLEPERVNLYQLVSDTVVSFNVIAESRGVKLNGPGGRADANVCVSVTHFERALANLLENALRFTRPGDAVDVQLRRNGSDVSVFVDDTCGGAEVDELARRLRDSPTTHGRNGKTGLGLPIARGLIEAQGGRIAVHRTRRGCRLALTVPIAEP